MSPDIIPARSEAEWPSSPEGGMSGGHEIMMTEWEWKLEPQLNTESLTAAAGRYHYHDADLGLLYEVYRKVKERLQVTAWCALEQNSEERAGREWAVRRDLEEDAAQHGLEGTLAWAAVTLGEWPDELQEYYVRKERYTESYMAECLCWELLREAYAQLNERLYAHTRLYASSLFFPGQELPLAWMERILDRLGRKRLEEGGLFWLPEGMMRPRQSVAYLIRLQEEEAACASVCAGCERKDCAARRKNEGVRQEE